MRLPQAAIGFHRAIPESPKCDSNAQSMHRLLLASRLQARPAWDRVRSRRFCSYVYAGRMLPAAPAPHKRTRKRRKRKSPGLLAWWPLAAALVLTPFAVRAASVLALTGPGALRALFPFVALIQALAPRQGEPLAAGAMWVQFPVYGLMLALFARKRRLLAGCIVVLLVHGAVLAAALFFSR